MENNWEPRKEILNHMAKRLKKDRLSCSFYNQYSQDLIREVKEATDFGKKIYNGFVIDFVIQYVNRPIGADSGLVRTLLNEVKDSKSGINFEFINILNSSELAFV